jgi:16S rRNA (adenine1518-N6/adenine1519-N6)-dimethyltransferase
MAKPKKSLGQHWLKDRAILGEIVDFAEVEPNDTVFEIGPGQGYLTSVLLSRAKKVIATEIDADLARKLPGQFPGKDLTVVNTDFLNFNLNDLPAGYKVVANIPYYITAAVVRALLTAANRPASVTLLVQKEVAERLAARPGQMSLLAVSAQFYSDVMLGPVVPAGFFTPPPKIDSQVVRLDLCKPNPCKNLAGNFARGTLARTELAKGDLAGLPDSPGLQGLQEVLLQAPFLQGEQNEAAFFRLVKIGFSSRRKKLVSNLAAGYKLNKTELEKTFYDLKLPLETRAQDLSIAQWAQLLGARTWQI